MQRRLLGALVVLTIACGDGATDVSAEVSTTDLSTTAPLRTTTTVASTTSAVTSSTTSSQPPTTTALPTTTTLVPRTTTTAVPTTTTSTTLTATTTTVTTTTTTAPPSSTVTITASNFAFSPASVTINRGDTVQWVLGNGSHTTTSGIAPTPDGGWDQTITASVAIVFSQPGQFNYFCRFHPDSMRGTIVVP